MYLAPMAARLLQDLEASHRALIEQVNATEVQRHGFRAVYEAISAGLAELNEEELIRSPSPEEWSMAEVVEHVAEHDRKYAELVGQGVDHYVEHGLEHAMQLWRMRAQSNEVKPA
ncbi:MAG: hypothetical protein ACR2HB_05580 [Dehalococcoidia bacterium]